MDGFHFLRRHRSEMTAPFIGLQQNFVRDDVEFFLYFTLYVFRISGAQYIAQGALADGMADGLAGARDNFDQQSQLGRNGIIEALLFN